MSRGHVYSTHRVPQRTLRYILSYVFVFLHQHYSCRSAAQFSISQTFIMVTRKAKQKNTQYSSNSSHLGWHPQRTAAETTRMNRLKKASYMHIELVVYEPQENVQITLVQ